jgi:predicted nucleotide-binding protein
VRIFIGSSTETLPIANEIQAGLAHDSFIVKVWTNRVFGASQFFLESLEEATNSADFAVLIIGPDDKVTSRNEVLDAPRDNVVFELGLFIGALGRKRVFFVIPKGAQLKIPTDLLGVNPITYSLSDPEELASQLGPVCTELRRSIINLGPR